MVNSGYKGPIVLTRILVIISISLILIDTAFSNEEHEIFVQLGHSSYVSSVAVSPDGRYLLTEGGAGDNKLKLWNIESGREIRTLTDESEDVSVLNIVKPVFSPDGNYVVASPRSEALKVWDIKKGKVFKTITFKGSYKTSAKFSPDGKYIIASGFGANEWNIETGKATFNMAGMASIDYSPDGKYIVIAQGANIFLARRGNNIEQTYLIENADMILSIKFSATGKYLLGNLVDTDVYKLWDTQKRKEVRRFVGLSKYRDKVIFSPDDKHILSVGPEYTLILWSATTGEKVRTFEGHSDLIDGLCYSPDGNYLVTSSMDKTIRLWDANTGRQIRVMRAAAHDIIFLSKSSNIITNGSDGILMWNPIEGTEIRRFEGNSLAAGYAIFSLDGRYVLSGGFPKSMLWNLETGQLERFFEKYESRTFSIALLNNNEDAIFANSSKGQKFRVDPFNQSHIDSLWERIKDDGFDSLASKSNVTNVERLNELIENPKFFSVWAKKYERLRAHRYIVKLEKETADFINKDFSTLLSYKQLQIRQLNKTLLELSYPAVCPRSDSIDVYNMRTGELLKSLTTDTEGGLVEQIVLSPDNKYALLGIYHAPDMSTYTDNLKALLDKHTRSFPTTKLLPPQSDIQQRIKKESRQLLKQLRGKEVNKIASVIDLAADKEIFSLREANGGRIAIDPDAKYMAIRCQESLMLFSFPKGKEILKFENSDDVNYFVFSPDGKYVLAGCESAVKLWDIRTGKQIKNIPTPEENILVVSYSPEGKYFVSGSWAGVIKVWNAYDGREIRAFKGHVNYLYSVAFSPNGNHIMSGGSDGTTRIWDVSSGKEIVRLIVFKDGEWIAITPEGYYNSSQNGHRYLNIRMSNEVYGINQFYDVFYRPDIVMAKLRGQDINSLIGLTIDDAIKNPPPQVELALSSADTDNSKIRVCYQAKSKGGGIGEVRWFHNGKLIQSDGFYKDMARTPDEKTKLLALNSKAIYEDMRSIKIKGKEDIIPITSSVKGDTFHDCKDIDTIPGENEVSVTAFNSTNTIQSYMQTVSFNSTAKSEDSHLYILTIGIDHYKDASINLKYAVKDSRDIQEKLIKQAKTIYPPQNIHHVILTDQDATKPNIAAKINELSQKMKPTDMFVMFVAGHGVLLQNQYYMLTNDYDGNLSDYTLISSNEIVEMSKKIKSLSQLFIFDTCHAGGVDNIVSGLYDARMSVLAKKMGLHIYASANDKQAAMDGYKNNGLFTYTLLDGLNNNKQADKNKDGKVTVVGLGEYSKKMTTNISKEIGHSQTPLIINFGKDNPVYMIR